MQNRYTAYEMKPEQDPDANQQLDVYAGVTAVRFSSTNTGEGTAGPWTRCISTAQCLFFLYLLDGFAKERAQLLVQKIQRKQMFKILKKMLDLEPTPRIILNFRRGR